ncbi:MAG: class I SAM-dependent methyltransferase [Candidatus Bathyarchaeia archaeon]
MVITDEKLLSEIVKYKLSLVDPWYQLIIEMLHSAFRDLNEKRVMEVGCGLGGFILYISENCEVVGLDISSKAIHTARDLAKKFGLQSRVNLIVGDAQRLPFKEDSGDIVVCSETLEHIPDYERAFSELVRVTKKSGYLCLTVPNFLSTAIFENIILLLIGQPSYVKSHVSVEKEHIFHVFKLRKLLNQHNVEVVTMRSVDFLHLPPRVRKLLKMERLLQELSKKIENFFAKYFSPLRLAGANIGVLVKKR